MTGYNWPEVNELIEKFREIERARIIDLLLEQKQELIMEQNHNGAAVLRDAIAIIKGDAE